MPVPGDATDGAFINHPDTDLADAACIKARWDPRNVFRHALSIPLP